MDYTNSYTDPAVDTEDETDLNWNETDDSSSQTYSATDPEPAAAKPKRRSGGSRNTPKSLVVAGIAKARELADLGEGDLKDLMHLYKASSVDDLAACIVTGAKADVTSYEDLLSIAEEEVRGPLRAHMLGVRNARFRNVWTLVRNDKAPGNEEDASMLLATSIANLDSATLDRYKAIVAATKKG